MFLSGKSGGIKVGAATWILTVWDSLVTTEALNVTDTESERANGHVFVENIDDLTACLILARGRRDATAQALQTGRVYEFTLEESADLSHVVSARVTKIRRVADANVPGGIALEVEAESTGEFDPAIT